MFDTTKLRSKSFDQLRLWRVYRLTRALRTADGRTCPSGMEFRFEQAIVNIHTKQAEIHGLAPDDTSLVFHSRDGEHREWFEDTGNEYRPAPPPPRRASTPAPAGGEAEWKRWLAEQPEFEDAAKVMNGELSKNNWGSARLDADTLRAAASALAPTEPAVARWLAERSLDLYHAWMSQATGGGEGSAMQYQIRPDLETLRRILG